MPEVSEERQRLRDFAAGAKTIVGMQIGWHADRVRIQLGQVECVEPEVEGARAVHCLHACAPYGHFHFVIDKVAPA